MLPAVIAALGAPHAATERGAPKSLCRSGPGPHSSKLLPELISFSSLRHDDLLICGAEPQGVEEHQVTTRGAFNPHGEGQFTVAVLPQGVAVSAGRNAAIYQEHGRRACGHGHPEDWDENNGPNSSPRSFQVAPGAAE